MSTLRRIGLTKDDAWKHAEKFANLCKDHFFYKPRTDPTGAAALIAASTAATVVAAIAAAPFALFGLPVIVAGLAKLSEVEEEWYSQALWNDINKESIVTRDADDDDGDGVYVCYFAVFDGPKYAFVEEKTVPKFVRVEQNAFFFRMKFTRDRLIALTDLN